MDYQTFDFVRFPFAESERRLLAGQSSPDDSSLKAFRQLIRVGKEMAKLHWPEDNFLSLYDSLGSALEQNVGKGNMGLLQPGKPGVPTLFIEAVDEFRMRLDSVQSVRPDEGRHAAISLFCAIFVECAEVPMSTDFERSAGAAALHTGIASYAAWKAFAEVKENSDLSLSAIAARSEERVHAAVGTAQEQLQEAIERNSALQKQDSLLRAQVQQTIQELKNDVEQIGKDATAAKFELSEVLKQGKENEERISVSRENIQRHADALREEFGIDTTKKLWQQRADEGTKAFRISTIAIAALLVGPIYYAFSHLESLIKTLQLIGDAATSGIHAGADATAAQLTANAVARLAVITIPLAVYFWAVKLMVRYNARSMMLMDDARQRQTMIDVYTHLIERSGATKEERALVLNALFRPGPGNGAENVEPPNFTELIGKPKAGEQ